MDSKCINKEHASILYIEYLPRTFSSADRTENYDSDDSVTYGKRFTAIIIKTFEKLEYLNRKTFAELA